MSEGAAFLAVDVVLAALAVEALLIAFFARHGRPSLLIALVPGLVLVLAVRFALAGQILAMLACLTAALPAHLIDLRRRLARAAGGSSDPT